MPSAADLGPLLVQILCSSLPLHLAKCLWGTLLHAASALHALQVPLDGIHSLQPKNTKTYRTKENHNSLAIWGTCPQE